MNKILLVYEDYADLMSVEATLKKVGFDVIGLSNEYSISEQMVAFNPDLVIGSGSGGRVSSLGVGKRLKETTRWQGKSLLIFPANFKPNPQELIRIRVDMILESPVLLSRLVQVVAKLLGHDEMVLLERLNKLSPSDNSPKPINTTGKSNFKFTPEDEAIFIHGTVDSIKGSDEEEIRKKDFALDPERVEEDSQDENTNKREQKAKFPFSFGDRLSDGILAPEKSSANNSNEAFPDVDLKALERELVGGGIPEVEKVEVNAETSSTPLNEDAELQQKAQQDLHKIEHDLKERIAKYSKMVADVKISPESTVTRVEARRRQKNLVEQFDKGNLSELDKLRQQFAKALFKK